MKVNKSKSYIVTGKGSNGWYRDTYLVRGKHLQIQNGNFGFTKAYKVLPRDHMSMLSIVNKYMDKLTHTDYYVIDEEINHEVFTSYIRIAELSKTSSFFETKDKMVKDLVNQTLNYVNKWLINIESTSEYRNAITKYPFFYRFTASHKRSKRLHKDLQDLIKIDLEITY